jgi:hypothetical protein
MHERRELQNLIGRLLKEGGWPVDKRDKYLAEKILEAGFSKKRVQDLETEVELLRRQAAARAESLEFWRNGRDVW